MIGGCLLLCLAAPLAISAAGGQIPGAARKRLDRESGSRTLVSLTPFSQFFNYLVENATIDGRSRPKSITTQNHLNGWNASKVLL